MKQIWQSIWNNPVVVIGAVTIAAEVLLVEWEGLPEAIRIVLLILVPVLGLFGTRALVSPTEEYKDRVPADLLRSRR